MFRRYNSLCILTITFVVAVMFFVLYLLTPVYGDDLWYMIQAKDCLNDPWNATFLTFKEAFRHLESDTGRLANLICPPWLCLFPRWLFSFVTATLIFLTLLFAYKLIGGSADSLRKYLFLGVYVLVLPWFDYMLTTTFALNYVWTSLLGLYVIQLFLVRPDKEGLSLPRLVLAILSCFVVGWMHEGFSVPLAGALAIFLLLNYRLINRSNIIAYIALLCGVIVLFIFPATWNRSSTAAFKLFAKPLNELLLSIIVFNCNFYLYCVVLILALRKRLLKGTDLPRAFFFLSFGIISSLIYVIYYGGQRVGWFNQMVCGIGILWVLGLFHYKNLNSKLEYITKLGLSIFLVVHLIAAVNVQYKLKQEFDDVISQIQTSPNGLVYYDIRKPCLDLSLFKTSIRGFNERIPLEELEMFYYDNKRQLKILPTDFIESNINDYLNKDLLYLFKDKYIISCGLSVNVPNIVNIYIDGVWTQSRYRTVYIGDNECGDSILWIVPHIQTMLPNVKIEQAKW